VAEDAPASVMGNLEPPKKSARSCDYGERQRAAPNASFTRAEFEIRAFA
jgi:hypothetical protein